MVLAAVDDLLFRSKIRTTAKQAGVDLTLVHSAAEIPAAARANGPTLVIFDLNTDKGDPISTIAEMKKDPALAGIRTLAFVSHVQTELIRAAKAAGADDVMPRSAFASQLADILLSDRTTKP
jgi:DNA-binding NarL/FixJ family response regulator